MTSKTGFPREAAMVEWSHVLVNRHPLWSAHGRNNRILIAQLNMALIENNREIQICYARAVIYTNAEHDLSSLENRLEHNQHEYIC